MPGKFSEIYAEYGPNSIREQAKLNKQAKSEQRPVEIRYQKRLCSPLQFGEAVRQLVRPSQPRARPELQSINLNREENRRAGSRHGTATQLYSAILAAARIIALMPPAQEKR